MKLSPLDLSREWAAGKFRAVYCLTGQPEEVKDALRELVARFKDDSFNFSEFSREEDPPGAAVSDAQTQPVFADRRLVVVSNPRIASHDPELFAEYLRNPSKTTTLVLVVDDKKPEKQDDGTAGGARHGEKKQGAKEVLFPLADKAGAVCVFAPLKPWDAVPRVREEARRLGKTLGEDAAQFLVDEVGPDLHLLRQELEKAALFVGKAKELTRDDLLASLGYSRGADPYSLSRLAAMRDFKGCIAHMRLALAGPKPSETAIPLVAQVKNAIVKQLKVKRMIARGDDTYAATKSVGIDTNKSFYDGYLGWLEPLSERRLLRDLRACLFADADLKSKSWLDARQTVDRLLVEICRGAKTPPRSPGRAA